MTSGDAPAPLPAAARRIREDLERRRSALVSAVRRGRAMADGEAVHDVRVGSRRVAAVLRLWRACFEEDQRKDLVRRLRRLRRTLGRAREAEVHAELLRERIAPREHAPNVEFGGLVERLERKRKRLRARAARRLRARKTRRLLERLESADLHVFPHVDELTVVRQARARLAADEAKAAKALEKSLATSEDALLHRARVATKKLRYGVESLRAVAPDSALPDLSRLRAVQEALGLVHDRATLRDRLLRWERRQRKRGTKLSVLGLLHGLELERVRALERLRSLEAMPPSRSQGALR